VGEKVQIKAPDRSFPAYLAKGGEHEDAAHAATDDARTLALYRKALA
jgi:hypothetical protein